MKKKSTVLMTAFFLSISNLLYSQWTTQNASGDINNTNTNNVGIGTNAPPRKLSIIGSLGITNTLDQASYTPGPIGTTAAPIDPVTGLAAVNANFGGLIFHSTSNTTNVQNMFWGQNFDYRNNNDIRYRINGPAFQMQFVNGAMYMYTAAAGIATQPITTFAFQPKIGLNNAGGFAIGGGPALNNFATNNSAGAGELIVQNRIGLGIPNPTSQLHTSGTVRFQGLTTGGSPTNFVSADANGQLWLSPIVSGGVQSTCFSNNFIPKSDASGNLSCSQIYDDGRSVGINETSNFFYNYVTVGGPNPAPSSGTAALSVNGVTMSLAYYATSDERKKKNISALANSLELIKAMNAKRYEWNTEKYQRSGMDNGRQIGYLAQDLLKVVPEVVIQKYDGSYAVNYNSIIPIISEGVKEQQVIIDELKTELSELKAQLVNLKGKLERDQMPDKISKKYFSVSPNPFSSETNIVYDIPQNASNSTILITDLQGKILKKVSLPTPNGKGIMKFNKENLPNGVYLITLAISGMEVQTDKAIISY